MINKKSIMCEEESGVVVIAPGYKEASYNEAIQRAVNQAKLPYPKALLFLGYGKLDIRAVVEEMEQRGVNKIITIPLFISSDSGQVEKIKENLISPKTQADISLTPALDGHSLIAEILAEHLMTISQQPDKEIAVLVGDGAEITGSQKKWKEGFASLAAQVKAKLELKDVRYGFATGNPAVREVVAQAQTEGQVIATPVCLVEESFAQEVIPQLLGGLDYHCTGKALIPHPNISRLIEWRVAEAVMPPLQFKKGDNLVSLSLDDALNIAMADGKSYPCSVLAFRLARIAFRSLWRQMPVVDGMVVGSYLPPEAGSRPVFESIAGKANVTYKGNWSEITPESSIFEFTDRATGLALHIKVKPDTFGGEGFFALRNRVINREGALGEEQLLARHLQETLSNLLSNSDKELFTWTIQKREGT
jgi:sirohydrochlorin ferrochelatase